MQFSSFSPLDVTRVAVTLLMIKIYAKEQHSGKTVVFSLIMYMYSVQCKTLTI